MKLIIPWTLFLFLPNPFIRYLCSRDEVIKKVLFFKVDSIKIQDVDYRFPYKLSRIWGFGRVEILTQRRSNPFILRGIFNPTNFEARLKRIHQTSALSDGEVQNEALEDLKKTPYLLTEKTKPYSWFMYLAMGIIAPLFLVRNAEKALSGNADETLGNVFFLAFGTMIGGILVSTLASLLFAVIRAPFNPAKSMTHSMEYEIELINSMEENFESHVPLGLVYVSIAVAILSLIIFQFGLWFMN